MRSKLLQLLLHPGVEPPNKRLFHVRPFIRGIWPLTRKNTSKNEASSSVPVTDLQRACFATADRGYHPETWP